MGQGCHYNFITMQAPNRNAIGSVLERSRGVMARKIRRHEFLGKGSNHTAVLQSRSAGFVSHDATPQKQSRLAIVRRRLFLFN